MGRAYASVTIDARPHPPEPPLPHVAQGRDGAGHVPRHSRQRRGARPSPAVRMGPLIRQRRR